MGWFFGYGSLVNHLTHDNRPLHRAQLTGWRREWCLTTIRPVAFLSVRPSPGDQIDGLLSRVPQGDWQALDAREFAYARQSVSVEVDGITPGQVAVYSVTPEHRAPENCAPDGADQAQGAILMSYLDVVVEGYLHHFGEDGAAAFFATTDGWARPVLDDRRRAALSATSTGWRGGAGADRPHLAMLGVRVRQLDHR